MASFYFGKFKPHLVTNTQLYIQRKDSTVSLCPDYSPNGFNLTQAVALQQPTLSANSIDFSTNDFMINNTANVFSGDNSGYIFFSGYYNSVGSTVNIILASCDATANTDLFYVGINASGQVRILSIFGGVTNNLNGNTVLTNGQFYHGWINTNGTTWTAKLNGITQTLTVSSGSNNGGFFNDIPNRDNLTIGALIRLTNVFGDAQINKIHYVSGSLSAIDLWKLEQFFSNPLNYI